MKKVLVCDIIHINNRERNNEHMIYNSDNPVIKIIGVEHMKWQSENVNIKSRSYSALSFRVCGSAKIEIDGNKYFAKENDVLYMPQNLSYSAEYTDTEIIVIHFITLKNDNAPSVRSVASNEELYKMFLNALAIWENKAPTYLTELMSLLYGIFGMLVRNQTEDNMPYYFKKGVSLINLDYKSSELSISGVCKAIGISEARFRTLFKKYYLKTPIEYITELRLDYAKKLISSGASVENAAIESGFNDSKYFARVVRKKLGCCPRELKNFGK